MRLTLRQRRELAVIRRFTPDGYPDPSDDDVRSFFAWSDRGVGRSRVVAVALGAPSGLAGLYWGKRHRDLLVSSYKDDWGTTCFPADFADESIEVREYLSCALGVAV